MYATRCWIVEKFITTTTRVPSALDLHDLNLQSSFATDQRRYSGTLGYRNGQLVMENYNPIPHDMDAEFDLTPQELVIRRGTLRSGPSQINLTGTVTDFANPKLEASYEALVDTGEFRRILKNNTLPTGVIKLAGQVAYASQPDVPMLAAVNLRGTMSSTSLRLRTPSFNGDLRDIRAQYSVNNGNAEVTDLHALVLGGAMTGTLSVHDLTGNSRSHLKASLNNARLSEVQALVNSAALAKVSLGGTVNLDADADWGRTLDDLSARSNATLNATLGATQGAAQNATPIPLDGVIHAQSAAAKKQVTLTNSSLLRTPQTAIDLNGTVSNRSHCRCACRLTNCMNWNQ